MSIRAYISEFRGKVASLREEKPWLRFLLNKYVLVTLAFIVWMLFIDNNNIGVWLRTGRQLRGQERRIEYLNREISSTEDRLDHLRSNRDSLEKFAREQYGFHEPDEDVYIVE
ncbi:MAG: septum formation initiator family protein [Bacteroidales bacterium]|nr:septum formation initiator family protein [Bacteroidales bacterium]